MRFPVITSRLFWYRQVLRRDLGADVWGSVKADLAAIRLKRNNKENQVENLLLIEDDVGLQKQLRWQLDKFPLQIAGNRVDALALVRRLEPEVVLLDLGLPPDPDGVTEGLRTLEEIKVVSPLTKVIVLTGNTEREISVRAVGLGAYDFCQKPFDPQEMSLILERAFALYHLEVENIRLKNRHQPNPLQGILTNDPQMQQVCRTVERVATSDVTVTVLGESGTGKELFARALHHLSPRSENRMVAINCAAIPENLLESELFGYEKGAFTGAVKQTPGRVELAHQGTLFLDEIGDLPLSLQAKLLRFLQERVIERIGGRTEIPVDVRVICATHCNLGDLIRQGLFREDLYYRLTEITLKVPPLRDRIGDAVLLAYAMLKRFGEQHNRHFKGFKSDALAIIEQYSWPGNVRELENVIKRASIMSEGPLVGGEDLGLEVGQAEPASVSLRQVREEAEREAILKSLARTNGNVAQAAQLLGVTRPTLYSLMEQYHLR